MKSKRRLKNEDQARWNLLFKLITRLSPRDQLVTQKRSQKKTVNKEKKNKVNRKNPQSTKDQG